MRSLLMRSPIAIALFWISAYLLITLLPLFILLIYPPPNGRGFWVEFSVALGFIGLAMMALQFVITARINRIEASYGIDILLQFHRFTSLVAFFMVLLHPVMSIKNFSIATLQSAEVRDNTSSVPHPK